MPERCAESWRLFHELEVQQRAARDEGCMVDQFYKPYDLIFREYQAHFKTCEQCRAWVDSWAEGAKNEICV